MPTKIRGTLLNCRPAFIHDYHRSPWKSPREPAPAVARLQFRWRWRNCAEDDFLNGKKLAKRKRLALSKMLRLSTFGFPQFVAKNNMGRFESSREASPGYCFQKPSWFVPKDTSAYDLWRSPSVDAWLFRDANTKELFFYACQL